MNTEQINDLLAKIAEPETPEERDAAWNEVANRLHYLNEIMRVIDRVKQYPDPDPTARARRVIAHLKNEAMLERKRAKMTPVHYAGELRKFYESVREEVDMRGNDCMAVFEEVRRRLSAEVSNE